MPLSQRKSLMALLDEDLFKTPGSFPRARKYAEEIDHFKEFPSSNSSPAAILYLSYAVPSFFLSFLPPKMGLYWKNSYLTRALVNIKVQPRGKMEWDGRRKSREGFLVVKKLGLVKTETGNLLSSTLQGKCQRRAPIKWAGVNKTSEINQTQKIKMKMSE